jgi:hypothetical protein
MTRLHAVILVAVFAIAGCIDDGLDSEPESTDNPNCSTDYYEQYCSAEWVDAEDYKDGDDDTSWEVPCTPYDRVIIVDEGALWCVTQQWVCLSACE